MIKKLLLFSILFGMCSIGNAQVVKQNGNSVSSVSGILIVADGGTGQSSLTQNGVLAGNGTSAVQVSTNISIVNNSLTIGNGTNISTFNSSGNSFFSGVVGVNGADATVSGYSLSIKTTNGEIEMGVINGSSTIVGATPAASAYGVLGFEGKPLIFNTSNPTSYAQFVSSLTTNRDFYSGGTLTQKAVLSCSLGVQTTSTGSLSLCVASDARLKSNIKDLKYNPDWIEKIAPRFYEWKDKNRGAGIKAGFVAQEVELIYPEAIVGGGNGMKAVDPNAMIAALFLEVKELRKRLNALEHKKKWLLF